MKMIRENQGIYYLKLGGNPGAIYLSIFLFQLHHIPEHRCNYHNSGLRLQDVGIVQ